MAAHRRRLALVAVTVLALVGSSCGGGSDDSENQQPQRVALLVIDDFAPASTPSPPPADGDTDKCAYRGIGTGEVGGKGAPDHGLPAGAVHGTVVLDEIRQELSRNGKWGTTGTAIADRANYGLGDPAVQIAEAWSFNASPPTREVILAGVHVTGYNTQQISNLMKQTVEAMKARGIKTFVFNMSFVVAPCDTQSYTRTEDTRVLLDMYRSLTASVESLNDLRATIDQLVGQNGNDLAWLRDRLDNDPSLSRVRNYFRDPAEFDKLPDHLKVRIFYAPLANGERTIRPDAFSIVSADPLNSLLSNLVASTDGTRVVPVAAAGNGVGVDFQGTANEFRLDFPFAPAIWPSVVSVSATSRRAKGDDKKCSDGPAGTERAWYSNSGEVMLDGDLRYQPPERDCVLLTGTSFAAPRLSHQQALYLLAGGTVDCGAPPQPARPPLGYVDEERGNGKANVWLNQTVPHTAQNNCPDFEKLIADLL